MNNIKEFLARFWQHVILHDKVILDEAKAYVDEKSFEGSWNDLTDKPFEETVERVTLANIENPKFSAGVLVLSDEPLLVADQKYYIRWGSEEVYERTATYNDNGELSIEVNGDPFAILNANNGQTAVALNGDQPAYLIIETDEVKIKTLDPKFLPEALRIGGELPMYIEWDGTYTDNGSNVISEITGTFEGNTQTMPVLLVKVSNNVLSSEQLKGGRFWMRGSPYNIPISPGDVSSSDSSCMLFGDQPYIISGKKGVQTFTISMEGMSILFTIDIPSDGVYFFHGESAWDYVTGLETVSTLKPLDEKFLPPSVVKSVNGNTPDDTGNVTIEIPEGFSGSWNDLTDKPFYSETTNVYSTSVTVTENTPGYYRNTIDTLPDLVIGDTYIVTVDGVDYRLVAYMSGGYAPSLGDLTLDGSGTYTEAPFIIGDTREDDNLCWFYTVLEGTTHTISISHEEVVKTIDPKYLPSIPQDTILDILTEAGAITPVADEDGSIYTDENENLYIL